MTTATILWAGKQLGGAEETRLRRLVHTLRHTGDDELADDFARFLPEYDAGWSASDRATGARIGPAVTVRARMDGESGIRLDAG